MSVASLGGGEVIADGGLAFAGTQRLAALDGCDLVFFPGGMAATRVINDEAFMAEATRLARGARYLTSVCTGSLILAATGLIPGRRAACHWPYARPSLSGAAFDCPRFPKTCCGQLGR